jgi:hypothetical protein
MILSLGLVVFVPACLIGGALLTLCAREEREAFRAWEAARPAGGSTLRPDPG